MTDTDRLAALLRAAFPDASKDEFPAFVDVVKSGRPYELTATDEIWTRTLAYIDREKVESENLTLEPCAILAEHYSCPILADEFRILKSGAKEG